MPAVEPTTSATRRRWRLAPAKETGDTDSPSRATLAICAAAVTLVVAAQVPLALGLLRPDVQYEAGHAKTVLAINALLAMLIVACASLRGRLRLVALAPGGALSLVTLLGAVTVGGHVWDFSAALLVAAAAWWIGRVVLHALGAARLHDVALVAATVGMGTIGLAVLTLGRLGAIAWWTAGLPVLALGVAGLRTAVGLGWDRRKAVFEAVAGSRVGTACAGLLLLQLGWIVVWLSAPEIMFDPLFSKTYLPDLWARTGSIGPLLIHPQLNVMGLAQVVAVPGHALGSEDVGRELQLIAWIALTASIWWWGRRSVAGPLAALAVGIAPQLVWQSTTAFDDLLLAAGATALAFAVFRTLDERPAADAPGAAFRLAVALGLLAGTCVWLKLHLVVVAAVLAGGWLIAYGPARQLPSRLAGMLTGVLVVAGPAFVLRWIDTGNPVFPTYNSIFKSSHYPPIDEPYNFPFWHGARFWEIVKLPYEAVVHPFLMSEAAPEGSFGLLVAAGVLGALIGWRGRRPAALIVWVAVVTSLAAWWIEFRYLRYAIPAAMVATVLILPELRDWRPGRRAVTAMLVVAGLASAAYLPSAVATFWNVPHRNLPFAAAFGRWSSEDYLRTVFPEKDALAAYQRIAPPGSDAVSDAHERLFVHARDLSPPWEVARLMELYGPDPTNPDATLRRLRRLGIGWAIVTDVTGPANALPWVSQLVAAHGTPVFADRGWVVYRLATRPPSPRPLAACDPQLRGVRGCWNGTLDATPGLRDGESAAGATRNVGVCPGETVAVQLTTAANGAGAQVSLNANGGDAKAGHNAGVVPAGSSGWVYGTAPPGATAMNVLIVPGADGGAILRARTAVLGRCSPTLR